MTFDIFWPRPGCMDIQAFGVIDDRPGITKHFPFLYFSVFLFLTTMIICLVLSSIKKSSYKHLIGTTWTTRKYEEVPEKYVNGEYPETFKLKVDQLTEKPSPKKFWEESKILSFLCGFNKDESSLNADCQEKELTGRDILVEKSRWKLLVDILAVFMALVSVGLWIWMI